MFQLFSMSFIYMNTKLWHYIMTSLIYGFDLHNSKRLGKQCVQYTFHLFEAVSFHLLLEVFGLSS
jgi:hypothetical protein